MSGSDDGPRLSRAMTYINKADEYDNFGQTFLAGAGGLVLSIFTILIGIGEAFAALITSPVDAFSDVTALLIRAGFGAPAEFIRDMWNTAAVALGMDPWMQLGPFVAMVGAASVVGTLWIFAWYVDVIDADTLTGIDYPVINRDQGGDMDDE